MQLGTGTSITFASGFFAEILDVRPPDASRESINTSHMGTTGAHTFTPAKLVDWGEVQVELAFDPSTKPPMNAAPESTTITFPDSETWGFESFMTGATPQVPFEDRMTITCTLKVSGDVTVAS